MLPRSALVALLTVTAAALALAAPASAGSLTASAPDGSLSAGDPLEGCSPDGSGTNFPDAEVEPFIDVNPTDAENIVAIYQQDRYSNGGSRGNVSSASLDGGLSWTQVAVPADTVCTGGKYDRASDPWLSFGPDGVLHAMSLVTDHDPPAGFGDNGMAYNRSTDGGLSWEDPILLIEDTDPRFLNDKNSMTADPNDSDFVYAVWDRLQDAAAATKFVAAENRPGLGFKGPIYFTRTTDGGDTWEPARKIWESGANKQALGDQIAVLPEGDGGDVLDFFTEFLNASNRAGFPRWLTFIRSTDQGKSWGKEERVNIEFPGSILVGRNGDSTIDVEPVVCPDPAEAGSCPIRSGDFIPDVAVDHGNGNLYAVWMDLRFDGGIFLTDHDNIAFSMSTDGGRNWSPAIKVNQTPTDQPNYDQQAFTPAVHVSDDGTVTVTYYDFRHNDPEDTSALETDYFAVHCHANCAVPGGWADSETRITPTSFDIREAPYARGYFLGDYMGLASAGDDFVSAFGQAFTQNDASQYFSRLTPGP
jgi:hypothetical protein